MFFYACWLGSEGSCWLRRAYFISIGNCARVRAVHQTVAVKFNSFSNLNCKLINKYIFVVTSVCKMSDFDVSDLCKRGSVCVCKIERSATHVVALYFLMCSAVALCLSKFAVTSLIIIHINTYIHMYLERSRVLVQRKNALPIWTMTSRSHPSQSATQK